MLYEVITWRLSTTNAGYSGSGYFEWLGGDKFGTPAAANVLTYTVTIPTTGDYTIFFRGRRDQGQCGCPADALSDACNDINVKVDNGSWIKTMIKGTWGVWICRITSYNVCYTKSLRIAPSPEKDGIITRGWNCYRIG